MISFGLQRERARDTDALALAAGELMRDNCPSAPAQAHSLEQLGDLRSFALPAADDAVHPQRLGHDVAGRHARIERGERILEDDLHLPPVGPQFRSCPGSVMSVPPMRMCRRSDRSAAARCGRPSTCRSRIRRRAQAFRLADREADAIDRVDGAAPRVACSPSGSGNASSDPRTSSTGALRVERLARAAAMPQPWLVLQTARRERQHAAQWPGRFSS